MLTVEQIILRMKGKRENLRQKREWLRVGSVDSLMNLDKICLLNELINEFEVYHKL